MKSKLIIIINIIALVFAVIWMINSNFDCEPIILCISFVGVILGLTIKEKIMKKNKVRIKGDNNEVEQGSKGSKSKKNEVDIKGAENKVKQK